MLSDGVLRRREGVERRSVRPGTGLAVFRYRVLTYRGRIVAVPPPDRDTLRSPFHGVYGATVVVELVAVRLSRGFVEGAALVAVHSDIAVFGIGLKEPVAAIGHGTRGGRVERHEVLRLIVDTFDNVNFAIVGPVGTKGPEGWPGSTNAPGHVAEVDDKQAVGIGLLTFQTNAVTSSSAGNIAVVYADVCNAAVGVDKALALCSALVDIVDVSVGWVVTGIEVEIVEETCARVILNKLVIEGGRSTQEGDGMEQGGRIHG